MATYYLSFNGTLEPEFVMWNSGAAGKARHDRETFAKELGMTPLSAYIYYWPKEPDEVIHARFDGMFAGLKRNDILIAQWVLWMDRPRWAELLVQEAKVFGAKLVFLVDDIASWREPDAIPAQVQEADYGQYRDWRAVTYEAGYLARADGLILHSPAMAQRLANQMAIGGHKMPKAVAYLGPSGHRLTYLGQRRQHSDVVDYAGSLSKAKFLLQLPQSVPLQVYGVGEKDTDFDAAAHPNLTLHPRVDPEAAPHLLAGSYGLVWDSESYPEVTGRFGDYERYNTPAKFAMYLAVDEPVIVWRQAAVAEYVERYGLGLVLDTLDQLPQALRAVTPADYDAMVTNVQKISPLIRSGFFTKRALLDITGQLLDRHHDAVAEEESTWQTM
ncbi:MAG: glycosyltransferase [Lactobacillus sp.]|jgi:hypothetical protein|nr:glycosyltransferase [Lactobacillus sp.]